MFQGITGAETNKTVKFYPMRVGNAMILQGIDCDGKTVYGYPYRDGNVCKAQTIYRTCVTTPEYLPDCCGGIIPCSLTVEVSGFSGTGLVYEGDYRETPYDLSVINGTYTLYEDGCRWWKNFGGSYSTTCTGDNSWEGSCGTHVGIDCECCYPPYPSHATYGATFITLNLGNTVAELIINYRFKVGPYCQIVTLYSNSGQRAVANNCDLSGMLGDYSMPDNPPGSFCPGSGGTATVSVPW